MIDLLNSKIEKTGTRLCAGLDTRLEYVPQQFRKNNGESDPLRYAAAAVFAYNCALMDAFAEFVPCVKIQAACYELYGPPGVQVLYDTIRYAKELGLITILDAKRNDIGSTASCYADAYLGRADVAGELVPVFNADFVTVNPYLGTDGIEPFLAACAEYDKGMFVLVKTSNPSSGELQDEQLASGRPVYEMMMDRVEDWGSGLVGRSGYSEVGAVVGATYPEQASALRRAHPGVFFLLPGAGTQGADVARLADLFDADGLGAIVNNSRAMLRAWTNEPDGEERAVELAVRVLWDMRARINRALEERDPDKGGGA